VTSKYQFVKRVDVEEHETSRGAERAQVAEQTAQDQRMRQHEEEQRRLKERAALLKTTVPLVNARVYDIITEYAQVEYGAVPAIREFNAPPDLHLWQASYETEAIIEVFLLVQGTPPETGFFVATEERPNLERFLLVLREYTGIVASRSQRATDLRDIIKKRVKT
jgi:hypothetical protein